MRRFVTGSRARTASSRVTVPNRLGSPVSANMTWVWNSSPCSLMMVCPTSTRTMRPSAVSEGGGPFDRDTQAFKRCPGHCGVGGAGAGYDVQFLELQSLGVADCYGHF